jgi:hypothetical protein
MATSRATGRVTSRATSRVPGRAAAKAMDTDTAMASRAPVQAQGIAGGFTGRLL